MIHMPRVFALIPLMLICVLHAAERPNIVIILADDLGYGDLGCYGATKVKTPNIDRLAAQGRRFTDFHSASAGCTPSRYSLLTGQYAWRVGNWGPIFCKAGLIVDPKRATVASMLKSRGYATAAIGKWHLGLGKETPDWNGDLKPGPLEVGYDYYFGLPVVSSHSPYVLVENHRVLGLDPADPLVFGGEPVTPPYPEKITAAQPMSGGKAAHALYKDDELGTRFTEKAVGWIQQHKQSPFLLYLATSNIHHPFTPAKRFIGTSRCGLYGDFIHELDWIVGQVMRTLDDLKLADNTILIFTSDNGGMLNGGGKEAWKAGHKLNGDWLGFKFGAWEGGHRVPFIVRWPGKVKPASESNLLASNVDLLATFAAILEHKLGPDDGPDSFNILPAILGDPPAPIRDHLVYAPVAQKNVSIRKGDWVYVSAQGSGGFGNGLAELAFTGEVNSDITAQGKNKTEAPRRQLYNLAEDPRQAVNVIDRHPDKARELSDLLTGIRSVSGSAPHAAKNPAAIPIAPAKSKGKRE